MQDSPDPEPSPDRGQPTPPPADATPLWTGEKIDALREGFGVRDELFLSRELGCSPEQLVQKAWEIFDTPRRDGPWTDGDVALLRRYLGAAETALIAKIIGRTPEEVDAKVVDLARDLRDDEMSVDEVVVFKRIYGTRKDEDLALIFGRRLDVVQRTAAALCLSKDKAFLKRHTDQEKPVRMPRWTAAELDRLRELYPGTSNLDIAKELGRSVKSVVSKAHNLGLKKDKARLQQMGRQNVRLRYDRYGE